MAATTVPLRSRRRPRARSVRRVGDERLVARVRAGDDDAFEAIYDRYYLGLLAFCRHMLGSRQEAEDALQHSFASAYRALRASESDVELRPSPKSQRAAVRATMRSAMSSMANSPSPSISDDLRSTPGWVQLAPPLRVTQTPPWPTSIRPRR